MINELSKKRLITIIELSGIRSADEIAEILGVDINYVRKKAFAHSISLKVQKTQKQISELDKQILESYTHFSAPEFCHRFKQPYQLVWRRATKLGIKFRPIKHTEHNNQPETTFEETEYFEHDPNLATI